MVEKDKPILVIDSGISGMHVFNQLCEAMPFENFIYVAGINDAMYTNQLYHGFNAQQNLYKTICRVIDWAQSNLNPKLFLIVCHDISTNFTLCSLCQTLHNSLNLIKISDTNVIEALNGKRKIGLLGSMETISTSVYQDMITEYNNEIELFCNFSEIISEIVEKNILPININSILAKDLANMFVENIDSLMYVCNYYAMLDKEIKNYLMLNNHSNVNVINITDNFIKNVRNFLINKGIFLEGIKENNTEEQVIQIRRVKKNDKKNVLYTFLHEQCIKRRMQKVFGFTPTIEQIAFK